MPVNQLKAGALLSYAIIGLNTLVGIGYTPYMLRKMGQSEFGLYSLVASFIAYLTIMDFGLGNAIVRYTAKFRAEGRQNEQYAMFGMFLLLYSAIGIIAFFVGMILYANVENLFGRSMTDIEVSRAKIMMLILTFNLAVTFPFTLFRSIITAYEDFIFQKLLIISRIILNTATMVVILEMGYKAVGMAIIVTAFNIFTLIANALYCHFKIGIKIKFERIKMSFLKEISFYSFWIFLNAIMDRVYWSTGQFVLGAVSGTIAVSVFAVAIKLQALYMQFSTAIAGVFLPRVTTMVSNNKSDEEISDLFIRTSRIQFIVISFILSGFIVFGKPFIILWAGIEYIEAYYVALLFFIPLTIPLIQNIGITILQARNQMKFRSLLYICIAVISLALQIIFAKKYGSIGVASAICIALFIGNGLIINVYYYKKQKLNIPRFWYEILKMSIIPIFLSTGFVILQNYIDLENISYFIFTSLIYSLTYGFLFFIVSMNSYERNIFSAPVRIIIKQFII